MTIEIKVLIMLVIKTVVLCNLINFGIHDLIIRLNLFETKGFVLM